MTSSLFTSLREVWIIWIEHWRIKHRPIHRTAVQEIEDLLGIVRSETVLSVHTCSSLERIKFSLPMSDVSWILILL